MLLATPMASIDPDWLSIASIIGLSVGALTLLVACWALVIRAKCHRVQAFSDILKVLEENRNARDGLEEMVAENPNLDVLALPYHVRQKLYTLARSYDIVGWLVYEGLLSGEFVLRFYSRALVIGWKYLSPLVRSARDRRRQPGHMHMFQMLAIESHYYRHKRHPKQASFDPTGKERNEWRTWRSRVYGFSGIVWRVLRLLRL